MSYQTITVKPDDGEPISLAIEARDALIWEKTGKGNPSILDYLREPSMVELYRLAHIAMKRQHQYPGDLKTFEETHDLNLEAPIEDTPQDDEPDPTESAASADD